MIGRSSYIGTSRLGYEDYPSDETWLPVVAKLCEGVCIEGVILSHDAIGGIHRAIVLPPGPQDARRNCNYLYDQIMPALQEAMLSDDQLHLRTGGNSACCFGADALNPGTLGNEARQCGSMGGNYGHN